MSTFTRKHNVRTVNDKLKETILGVDKKAKKRLLKAMAKLIEDMTAKQTLPPQSVGEPPTT